MTSRAYRLRNPGPLIGLVVLTVGCATAPRAAPPSPDAGGSLYLVDPLVGFPDSVSLDQPEQLRALHLALREGRRDEVRAQLDALSRSAPLSASVLQSELDLLEGRFTAAADRLRSVVEEFPEYTAAQLVLGRAEERQGRIVEAYAAYRAAVGLEIARRRVVELEPRVLEVLDRRFVEALNQGQVEAAEATLDRLAEWAPNSRTTLQRTVELARAQEEPQRELEALRRLTQMGPDDSTLRRRQAALEVDWGDPGTGLRLYEELQAAAPDDAELAAEIERARGAFRLSLLPGPVQDLTSRPTLTRGEFAGIVYWLVPSVRTMRGVGRIATDVLESPFRREIVRVVNLGLLGLDSAQHLFRPQQPIRRHDALLCFLRLAGDQEGAGRCLGGAGVGGEVPPETVCSLAAGCGLQADAMDCQPNAPVSGAQAMTLARQILGLGS